MMDCSIFPGQAGKISNEKTKREGKIDGQHLRGKNLY